MVFRRSWTRVHRRLLATDAADLTGWRGQLPGLSDLTLGFVRDLPDDCGAELDDVVDVVDRQLGRHDGGA